MSAHNEAYDPLSGARLSIAVVRGAFLFILSRHYGEQLSPNTNLEKILDELVHTYYELANAHRFDLSPEEIEEFYSGQGTQQTKRRRRAPVIRPIGGKARS